MQSVIRQTCRCNIMVKCYPVNSMEFMVIGIFSSNISMSSSMEKSHNCTKYGQISGIFRGGGGISSKTVFSDLKHFNITHFSVKYQ